MLFRSYRKSLQGDSQLKEIFTNLGVETIFDERGIILYKSKIPQSKFCYNFECEPDIAQTVVVTCCVLKKSFHFKGLQTLKIKETNRIEALINECKKLGYVLYEPNEGELAWDGTLCEKEIVPEIETYKDHRMAMAFAPACIKLGEIKIKDAMVVTKSYPNFWEDLISMGFEIRK